MSFQWSKSNVLVTAAGGMLYTFIQIDCVDHTFVLRWICNVTIENCRYNNLPAQNSCITKDTYVIFATLLSQTRVRRYHQIIVELQFKWYGEKTENNWYFYNELHTPHSLPLLTLYTDVHAVISPSKINSSKSDLVHYTVIRMHTLHCINHFSILPYSVVYSIGIFIYSNAYFIFEVEWCMTALSLRSNQRNEQNDEYECPY